MSPSKSIAAVLIATVLLPTVAVAQSGVPVTSTGPDLFPLKIDVQTPIVGKTTAITATIANQGNVACCANGWQVVFSRDPGEVTCFADSRPVSASNCTVRLTPASNGVSVAPSTSTPVVMPSWTPTSADARGVTIYVWITPLGCDPTTRGTNQVCGYQPNPEPGVYAGGPDGSNYQNNLKAFTVAVKDPAVRAEPVRQTSPDVDHLSKKVNDPYEFKEITTSCAAPPASNDAGCKVLPGRLVRFTYKVWNVGNAQDTFLARVVDTGTTQGNNLTGRGYKWSFAPWHVTVPGPSPNGAPTYALVDLEILVPATEILNNGTNVNGSANGAIKIEWSSETNPDVTTEHPTQAACGTALQDQGLCTDPTWPSLVVDAERSVVISSNDTLRLANYTAAGQAVTFNITINNTGNAADVFSVVVDYPNAEINGSWQGVVPDLVSIPPFTNRTIELRFTPPRNATKGLHHFDVIVASTKDTTGRARARFSFAADLQQWFGVHGALNANVVQVVPAETAQYVLFVQNDGNGPDNATIEMRNEPFGWRIDLSKRSLFLQPGQVGLVYLNVTPPMNTPATTAASIFLNVTSQGEPTRCPNPCSAFSTNATVIVTSGPNLDLSTPTPKSFVDPGATTSFDVTVRNTGNVVDNFTVNVQRSQDQLAWISTSEPSFLVLSPTATGVVHVTLRAPANGAVGETTKIFVTVNSSVNVARFKQLTLEGEVSGPDVFISSVELNATNPYSGDPLELNLVVGNAGNKPPSQNITLKTYFVQGGVPRPIGERTFTPSELPGGRRLTERMVWDTTAIDGSGVIIARFDEANDIPEIDETNNEASRSIVIRTFAFQVIPAEPLSGHPGEKISYDSAPHAFTLRYDGNQATENVTAIVESQHGWGHTEQSLMLLKGTPVPIFVDVAIPQQPGVASDVLTLRVVAQLRPNAAITARVTTTVIDENAPRILAVTATPAQVKLGELVTLHADVTDETGLRSVRAILVTPANETQTVTLDPLSATAFEHTQAYLVAGTFRLYVEAVDGSENANRNTSRDTLVSFTVAPGSAPVIKLAAGQATTLRTGVPIRLDISDPLGIGEVTYTIKGATYRLERPFSIDTAQLKEGAFEISVTAANIYGVPSTAKFQLTIDNTPPVIRSVTLNPSTPRANQDAVLHVETDGSTENVTVAVKKDGQVVETRAAAKKSAGVFELTVTPGVGAYTLDVTAEDAAGNQNVDRAAVQFTAKTGSPLPMPGLGLVLAGLVALALVLRRRGA